MKIALPCRNNQIDNHFGHCEYFTVVTIDMDSKKITNSEKVESPEGCGCKSNIAEVLAQKGVTIMLAGNMGLGAVNVLERSGIEVIRGCSGDLNTVTSKWLDGSLKDSGDNCNHHECNHG
ncbi:NifB/NifX family molybdenum-iron cluster-binding protein [Clostridium sp.]|uniref:NifB/NifX family molybdenum-iron cluster-binding protein n=1 Tax=Clostridium sp. TaxID=1506 RepID=UPI003F3536AA